MCASVSCSAKYQGHAQVYLLDCFFSGIQFYLLLSPYLCFIPFLYLGLYVLGDDAWVFHANEISMGVMPLCTSVYLNLVVNCWERADLLAFICGV